MGENAINMSFSASSVCRKINSRNDYVLSYRHSFRPVEQQEVACRSLLVTPLFISPVLAAMVLG